MKFLYFITKINIQNISQTHFPFSNKNADLYNVTIKFSIQARRS